MKIYLRNIANSPHMVFVISWALCLFLYSLGGAGILPKLTFSLFIFIALFLVLFCVTSFFLNRTGFSLKPAKFVQVNYTILLIINTIFFLPNFIYSGIPLLSGTKDATFGVPGLMILAVSFNSFTCVYCYYAYLHTGKKKLLLYVGYCLLFFALMSSRGSIMQTGAVMFFLWLNVKNPGLTFKKIAMIFAGLLIIFYLFGVAGNYRTINGLAEIQNPDDPDAAKAPYSSDFILQVGDASDAFRTVIPGEFFWTYLYLTSPLSNLQYNVDISHARLTLSSFYNVVIHETTWDFISKRIDALHKGYARRTPVLLVDALTVSTTLAGSYTTAGWGGMVYIMLFYWVFPVFYLLIIAKNPLAVIGVSTLCTIYLFSVFDNIFVLSGFSFQIFYPIIIMVVHNSIKLRRVPSSENDTVVNA